MRILTQTEYQAGCLCAAYEALDAGQQITVTVTRESDSLEFKVEAGGTAKYAVCQRARQAIEALLDADRRRLPEEEP